MTALQYQGRVWYDPLGDDRVNRSCTVFYDPSKQWGPLGRPYHLMADGGGFLPGSGVPPTALELELIPNHARRAYEAGWAIVILGYSVADPEDLKAPRRAAFDYQTFAAAGTDLYIPTDSLNLRFRCAEKDAVNCVQHIAQFGFGDLSPVDFTVYGKSAGCITVSFLAFGNNRANPAAEAGSRYTKNTRPKAAILTSTIASPAAWKYDFPDAYGQSVLHWFDGVDDCAATIGEAIGWTAGSATGTANMRQASATWYGQASETVKALNAAMPVFIENGGTPEYGGPYLPWAAMLDKLTTAHPPESTLAFQQLLQSLSAYPGYVHDTISKFYINYPGTAEAKGAEQWAVMQAAIPRTFLATSEPVEQQVIDKLIATLRKISPAAGYWTPVVQSSVIPVDADVRNLPDLPGVVVASIETSYDDSQASDRVEFTSQIGALLVVPAVSTVGAAGSEMHPDMRAVRRFIADVQKVLEVDAEWNATVISWRIVSSTPWLGDGPLLGAAGAEVLIEVRSRFLRNAPEVLAVAAS